MRRGELWTVAGGSPYTNKPRPVLVIQDDQFGDFDSVIVCPLSTSKADAAFFRPVLLPNDQNGLRKPSRVMVEKVVGLRKERLGKQIGRVERQDLVRVEQALMLVMGMARPSSAYDED